MEELTVKEKARWAWEALISPHATKRKLELLRPTKEELKERCVGEPIERDTRG